MNNQRGQIISASRRSDIPAFYGQWFLEQVYKGFVDVPNPFSGKSYRVLLHPKDVSAIVFWSKNYSPFFPLLRKIESLYQRRFLFHFTINGYQGQAKRFFEPNSPTVRSAVTTAYDLSKQYGREAVLWRFDPIIFSNISGSEERLSTFQTIAEELEGITKRCYISFVDLYNKVQRRFHNVEQNTTIRFQKLTFLEQVAFTKSLNEIAQNYGITLFSCCEDAIADASGIAKGHCIDALLLQRLYPDVAFGDQIKPSRNECGCYASRDIGSYNTCQNQCLYCYACR